MTRPEPRPGVPLVSRTVHTLNGACMFSAQFVQEEGGMLSFFNIAESGGVALAAAFAPGSWSYYLRHGPESVKPHVPTPEQKAAAEKAKTEVYALAGEAISALDWILGRLPPEFAEEGEQKHIDGTTAVNALLAAWHTHEMERP